MGSDSAHRPIILVGPLPLPYHGISVTFELLRDELVAHGVEHKIVDTNDIWQWRSVPRNLRKIIEWLFIGTRYALTVLRPPTTVYLVIAQSRIGLMRDVYVIALAALMRHRIVLHANCGDYGGFFQAQSPRVQRLICRVLRRAESIVVPSDRLIDMFAFDPAVRSRVSVVPNGAPVFAAPATARPALSDEIRLVYLSNFLSTKGYAEVIRVVDILRRVHHLPVTCRLVGEFLFDGTAEGGARNPDQSRVHLESMIRNQHLEEHITILPAADYAAKQEILQESHFLLLPTRYFGEAQPVSIIEALAAGCVPIAPDYRAIPDMIVHDETGILAGPEPENIATAILTLSSDPARYVRMSQAAVAHHLASFTSGMHLRRMFQLLVPEASSSRRVPVTPRP